MFTLVKIIVIYICLRAANGQRRRPTCNMTDVIADQCGKKLIIFGNRDFNIPKDESGLLDRCDTVDEGLQCLKKYSKTCLDPFSSQAIKIVVKNGIALENRICKDPDGRKELLEHLRCFKTDDHLSRVHLCMEKFIVQIEHLSNITGDHRIPAVCCSSHLLNKCVKQKTREVCENKSTPDFIQNMISDVTNELISYACGKYKSINDCDQMMDKNEWQMIKDIVASDDPEVISKIQKYESPFLAIKDLLKALRDE